MDKKPQDSESRHADKFIVRFPDGMRDRIAESAKGSGRTMNAEVVARLQTTFEPARPAADATPAQELADSRGQTIRALAVIQRTLCANLLRLFATLGKNDQSDRGFREAVGLAESLLDGAQPNDYLNPSTELAEALRALQEAFEAQMKKDSRRVISQRPQRTNIIKR